MSLPYRPDLWHDPETRKPTPYRAALGYLFCLLRDGLSDEEAADELWINFKYFEEHYRNGPQQALNFVRRNRWRVKRYLHQHERIRASKNRNFQCVLMALKHAGGIAKVKELKVVGQGKGGKHATFLSPITIERHLRQARKLGLVTVDRYGVWQLIVVDQADNLTNKTIGRSLMLVNVYKPDLTTQANILADLLIDQQAFRALIDSYNLDPRASDSSLTDNQCSLEFDPRVLDRSLTDRHHSITDKAKNNTLTDDEYRLLKRWMIDDHSSRRFSDWRLFSSSMTNDHRLFGDLMTDSLSTDRDRLGSLDSDEENDVRRRAQLTKKRDFTLFWASCDRESGQAGYI